MPPSGGIVDAEHPPRVGYLCQLKGQLPRAAANVKHLGGKGFPAWSAVALFSTPRPHRCRARRERRGCRPGYSKNQKPFGKILTGGEGPVKCPFCKAAPATQVLGACGRCLKSRAGAVAARVAEAHRLSRSPFPSAPPRAAEGVTCHVCGNECRVAPGEKGFCGLRENRGGRLVQLAGTPRQGVVTWYHDPLPTNCVADWVCAGGTGAGYPRYAYTPGPERGYTNLAVFLGACSFDCLFCQNRGYHQMARHLYPLHTPEELAAEVTDRDACLCYFGGDPSPQMPFALKAARLARQRAGNRIFRICWETNGNVHPRYLRAMAEISLISGGCIKFDLKAWDASLHLALTGTDNRRVLENFRLLAGYTKERPDPPFLVASTLLVPGYVDEQEVGAIARFIAELDPDIPYTLLAFYPHHLMSDLPLTPREEAEACERAAREAGLSRVQLGNVHLLA